MGTGRRRLKITLILCMLPLTAASAAAAPHHPLSQIYPVDTDLNMSGHSINELDALHPSGGTATVYGTINMSGNEIIDYVTDARSGAPNSPAAGQMWFDAGQNVLKYYNGTRWVVMASANAVSSDLQSVLGAGNSAGSYDINMSGQDLIDTGFLTFDDRAGDGSIWAIAEEGPNELRFDYGGTNQLLLGSGGLDVNGSLTTRGTIHAQGNTVETAFIPQANALPATNYIGQLDNAFYRADKRWTCSGDCSSWMFDGRMNTKATWGSSSTPIQFSITFNSVQHYWGGLRIHFNWGRWTDSFTIERRDDSDTDGSCSDESGWSTLVSKSSFSGYEYQTTNTGGSWACGFRFTFQRENTNLNYDGDFRIAEVMAYRYYRGHNGLYLSRNGDSMYGNLNMKGNKLTNAGDIFIKNPSSSGDYQLYEDGNNDLAIYKHWGTNGQILKYDKSQSQWDIGSGHASDIDMNGNTITNTGGVTFDDGSTMTKAPRSFRVSSNDNCPGDDNPHISKRITLDSQATIYVDSKTIKDYGATNDPGNDLYLYVSGSIVARSLHRIDEGDWVQYGLSWTGTLSAGSHWINVSEEVDSNNAFGCGDEWSYMNGLIFE